MIAMFMTIPKVAIYMQNAVLKRKRTFATNVLGLCVRWGFPSLKPIDNTKFNLSKNDYR